MDRLQFGMGEVRSHFAAALLIFGAGFGQVFASRLHTESDDVLATDRHQFHGPLDVILVVDHQKRNVEKQRTEPIHSLVELSSRRQLVAHLRRGQQFFNSFSIDREFAISKSIGVAFTIDQPLFREFVQSVSGRAEHTWRRWARSVSRTPTEGRPATLAEAPASFQLRCGYEYRDGVLGRPAKAVRARPRADMNIGLQNNKKNQRIVEAVVVVVVIRRNVSTLTGKARN